MKIAIIGAGPVGNYCASLLAKKGYEVDIYEDNKKVGIPIQCTGIVTSTIKEILPIKKEFLVNEMKYVEAFSSGKATIKAKSKDLIINRTKFDQYLANKAQDNGATLHLSSRFITAKDNTVAIKQKNKLIEKKADIIIGAEGVNSQVSKLINKPNILNNKNYQPYKGKQALIQGNFNKDTYNVYFGSISPKFFGWVVPENNKFARVGLATQDNPTKYFQNFLKKLKLHKNKIIDHQGGLIPIHNPNLRIQKKNIYLLGDAATQIKSTTGGGIIPGLKCAQQLVKSIENNQDYRKNTKKIYKGLKLNLFVRKLLDKMNDNDYDTFMNSLNTPKIKEILANVDRDKPFDLLSSLGKTTAMPRLLALILLQKKFYSTIKYLI